MNRDIKFRAWTKYGMKICSISEISDTIIKWPTGTEIMRCTDLKCIKGDLIYEDDVVDAWTSRYPDQKIRGFVIWNEHCASFQLQYGGVLGNNPTDFIHKWHFFERIGNLHENPELRNYF